MRRTQALSIASCLLFTACAERDPFAGARAKLPSLPAGVAEKPVAPLLSALLVVAANPDLSSARLTNPRPVAHVYDTLRNAALTAQAPLVAWLDRRGYSYEQHYLLNAVAVSGLTMEQLLEVAARPEVSRVQWDFSFGEIAPPGLIDPGPIEEDVKTVGDNILYTGADKAWALGATGQGIVVAGQDTGIDWTHPALKKKYRGYSAAGVSHDYNWHDAVKSGWWNPCGYALPYPCDDFGHGTHTLGTMVGGEGSDKNAIGMAPAATWIGCRNMDEGYGTASHYLSCFEFFLAPFPNGGNPLEDGDPTRAAHVINNSWTCEEDENCPNGDEFVPVLQALDTAGIFTVVSAGNDGPDCGTITKQPASLSPYSFSVGAVSWQTDTITSFSSRGPSGWDAAIGPDVMAPGFNIRSAVPGGYYQGGWKGTSMAGPHVAGLVALLWSADPGLIGKNAETRALISSTARKKKAMDGCGGPLEAPNNIYGHGIIDAHAAVKAALAIP